MTRLLPPVLILLALASGCSHETAEISRVVVVTLDTTRADRIGCYGYEAAGTPNLDRFAREAVLFEQAVSPVPTTLPSHSTMFTGLYPQDHGVRYNLIFRLGPDAVTLPETLTAAGFATAGFPASYVVSTQFGLDQGFGTFENVSLEREGARIAPQSAERNAEQGVDLALDWLDEHPTGKSFLWLHFYDPHHPLDPPFPYSADYRERLYDGEIAYTDAQFGRLLDRLQSDPEWERTLLIVAGDHGEGLHDHRERWHSLLVYETTQRVPLIVRAPGLDPARIAEPVTLADLTPTILDLVGLDPLEPSRGISLRPGLEGGELPLRDIYFESLAGSLNYGWAELRGLRSGRFKLIESSDPELFDLTADPDELNNLAALEPDRTQEMRDALAELAAPIGDSAPAPAAHDPALDAETEAFLASLGYVGGGSGGSADDAAHPRDLIDLMTELQSAQGAIAVEQWDRLENVGRYVLDRDPKNKWALANLVTALLSTDRPAEAQDFAAELIRLYPDNEVGYAAMARTYHAQNDARTAYEVLDQGLALIPDSGMLSYLRLVASFDLDRPTTCTDDVPAAIERMPRSGPILVLKARCEAREGQFEASLATLREAVNNGFKQLARLEEAEDFAPVRELPEFSTLLDRLAPPDEAP